MQYNKMKFAVGIFVITLFISLASFTYLLLDEKGVFEKRYTYYFLVKSADNFSVGTPLKFSGFNIGVIDKLSLMDSGNVKVAFSLPKKNTKWISQGSYLLLKKSLIGAPVIEVHSTIGNKPIQPNSTIEMRMSNDINDMISKLEPLIDKISSIINGVDKIVYNFSQDDSDLFVTMKNINTLSTKLAQSDSLLTSITGDKNSTQNIIHSLNQTTKIMQELNQISQNINTTTASLDQKILDPSSQTIHDVDAIMKDIQHKLQLLNGTVEALSSYDSDLTTIKEQISVGIVKSNQIMDKVDAILQDDKDSELVLP